MSLGCNTAETGSGYGDNSREGNETGVLVARRLGEHVVVVLAPSQAYFPDVLHSFPARPRPYVLTQGGKAIDIIKCGARSGLPQ